jgi:hypothetical protein
MFERENAFYEAHKTEFREKYLKKWLVIAGDALVGVFDTPKDAFLTAQGRHFQEGGKTSFSFAAPPLPNGINLADKAEAANGQIKPKLQMGRKRCRVV